MLFANTYHKEFAPPLALKDAIKCFWYHKVDFEETGSGLEILPDGYAEIIFYFGSECTISKNGIIQPLASPYTMGLVNTPVVLNAKNKFEVIAIRCYPWTVFDLLGLPPGKDNILLHEHPIAQLQQTLNEYITIGKIEQAINLVQQYFINIQPGNTINNSTLIKAGAAMNTTKGTLPVNQVANAAHTTVRTLERKFKQSSGHTVKDVSGLMRFEQVRNHLITNPNSNLAGLAEELGYTDQSHLSKEFKRYSGTTPAAFIRKINNK